MRGEPVSNAEDLAQTYAGSAKSVRYTTDPADLGGVTVTYLHDAQEVQPRDAGTYQVVATMDNANYQAQEVRDTLTIAKARAQISLVQSSLSHTYDGTAKGAAVEIGPTAAATSATRRDLAITYDGQKQQPASPDSRRWR